MVSFNKRINFQNMVTIEQKDDIHSVFKRCQKLENEVFFWQHHNNFRQKFTGNILEVDEGLEQILFKINNKKFEVHDDSPLFLYEDNKGFVTKSDLFFVKDDTVLITTPDEMKLTDLRKNTRYNLMDKINRLVFHSKTIGLGDKLERFSLRMNDISQTGMSLEIQKHKMMRYEIGDEINFKEIVNIPVHGLKGKILYTCHHKNHPNGKNVLKAGIAFNQAIDRKLISNIFLNINKLDSA